MSAASAVAVSVTAAVMQK